MAKLTVGIVNWNTKDLLEDCLHSVLMQKTFFPFRVVVVDNASGDGSADMVAKKFHNVVLIRNNSNRGMAAAMNQVIDKNAEYFLFIHPDTKLGADVLQKMVDYLDSHHEVGIAGCKIVYPDGSPFASCHRFPTLSALVLEALPTKLARLLKLQGLYLRTIDYDKEQEVDIIASACIFVRKKCLDDIGLFDNGFTNWMAEWDLAARAKKNAWKVMYAPLATVVHYEGQTTLAKSPLEYKRYSYVIADKMLDSLFLFYRKHYSFSLLVVLKAASIMGMMVKSAFYAPLVLYPQKSEEARQRIWHYLKTSIRSIIR